MGAAPRPGYVRHCWSQRRTQTGARSNWLPALEGSYAYPYNIDNIDSASIATTTVNIGILHRVIRNPEPNGSYFIALISLLQLTFLTRFCSAILDGGRRLVLLFCFMFYEYPVRPATGHWYQDMCNCSTVGPACQLEDPAWRRRCQLQT